MPITPDGSPTRTEASAVRRNDDDGAVTVRTPSGELVELNSTAAALWDLCDGGTTVREIIDAATTLFAGSPGSIERDIVATLDRLEDQGLITS